MARAVYRQLFPAAPFQRPRREASQARALVVLGVTVTSLHAHEVRRVLAAYVSGSVLRCIPHPHGRRVRLELQMPASVVGEVMRDVMRSIPSGELGTVTPGPGDLTADKPVSVYGL